ncbi:hypothetical protein [Shewanella woodyi]|uniref:Uncharacterized protein n=1 Tax=Shewanella woodyi (strain ATCC 51908 / MS32) TaxID=392500 RepID=B1KJS4_SHEWM|nr:hypothetical protein [Shewanella woodyi]ACA85747.1 hypothetical protein Swoo_1459 [Shewanella woodyi ATCC 51908]
MDIVYSNETIRVDEILSEHIEGIEVLTIACINNDKSLGFEKEDINKEVMYELLTPDSYIYGPKDKEPTYMSEEFDTLIWKKAGGPCLIFSVVEEQFLEELNRLKMYKKNELKAKLKKIDFSEEQPLLQKVYSAANACLDSGSLKKLLSFCRNITIWRFGDLGLYCHVLSTDVNVEKFIPRGRMVEALPEW